MQRMNFFVVVSPSLFLLLVLVLALKAVDVVTAAEGGPIIRPVPKANWKTCAVWNDDVHLVDAAGSSAGARKALSLSDGGPGGGGGGGGGYGPGGGGGGGPGGGGGGGPGGGGGGGPGGGGGGGPGGGGDGKNVSTCIGIITCPNSCPNCTLSCDICGMLSCPSSRCDTEGSVCEDPKFIGGDGVMFYFHGYKDKDFCIISDRHVHVNAHFIGKRPEGRTRDFTWVQALTFMWEGHQLYVGALKTKVWDSSVDRLEVVADGKPVELGAGEAWRSSGGGAAAATIRRTMAANAIQLDIDGILSVSISIVPITARDSRIHGYGIGPDDCFAHLEIGFDRLLLSAEPTGVLGQTYAPGFVNPVRRDVAMPIMGGAHRFLSSSLYAADCAVSRFTPGSSSSAEMLKVQDTHVACTTSRTAGFVCRK